VVWKADYMPFGEDYQITSTHENDKMFVGKEKDKETGLYYFGARYMEAVIGRFICPDPVGAVDPKKGKINERVLRNPQRINLYAYSLNNPYRYLDQDGGWPEEVHNLIINKAFSEGRYSLLPWQRALMQMGSVHVDEDQSTESSYKHAMRVPGQSVEDAQKAMNKFIDEKIQQYKKLLAQGDEKGAYFALGEAMHPLMDSTSPTHQGFQIWYGLDSPRHIWDGYVHSSGETLDVFNSNRKFIDKSVDLVRRLYDRANQ